MKLVFLSAGIASILAANALAGTMGPISIEPRAWVGSISIGPLWSSPGEIQTFFLTPEIEKTYAARKASHTQVYGDLFIGLKEMVSDHCIGHFGLTLATTSNTQSQGDIWDEADPLFDDLSYQYSIQNTRLAARGKLFYDKGYWLTPWLTASLGLAFNRAYHFTNTPLIFEALPNPNFSDKTTTAFSYTLGFGFEKCINEHWHAGLGYEFADWGKSELGQALGQTLNSGLKLHHLYTNGLLLNLTYVT